MIRGGEGGYPSEPSRTLSVIVTLLAPNWVVTAEQLVNVFFVMTTSPGEGIGELSASPHDSKWQLEIVTKS